MSEENVWYPYDGIPEEEWENVTRKLIKEFPLSMDLIVDLVLESWEEIFTLTNKKEDFIIGKTVFPKPQMMGFFLEEIFTQKIHKLKPEVWIADRTGYSKDLENTVEPRYSVEIKTSSSPKNIYGNRSYGQKGDSAKKSKDGYYLAINFEKFDKKDLFKSPQIKMIRFGYLNYYDWNSQKSSTGQQARIFSNVEKVKLLPIYVKED